MSAFKPSSLYVGGYKGFALDLSDKTTLYQDSARTTLVSAAGDPIGSPSDISGNGAHPTQATTSSKPLWQGYGDFDGVDDYWVTPSIDFSGTGQVTVVVGVRKGSDATTAALVELSATDTNNGYFGMFAPSLSGSRKYEYRSRGTLSYIAVFSTSTSFNAPNLAVATGQSDLAAGTLSLRLNGAVAQSGPASMGGGTYGNYPIYIGRRGGTSSPFTGRIYRLLVIGRALTASELAQAERWCATPTGVTLP